jgi:hypothetical protein
VVSDAFWYTLPTCSSTALLSLRSQAQSSVGDQFPAHGKGSCEESESELLVSPHVLGGWTAIFGWGNCIRNDDSQGDQLGRDLLQASDSLCNGVCCEVVVSFRSPVLRFMVSEAELRHTRLVVFLHPKSVIYLHQGSQVTHLCPPQSCRGMEWPCLSEEGLLDLSHCGLDWLLEGSLPQGLEPEKTCSTHLATLDELGVESEYSLAAQERQGRTQQT